MKKNKYVDSNYFHNQDPLKSKNNLSLKSQKNRYTNANERDTSFDYLNYIQSLAESSKTMHKSKHQIKNNKQIKEIQSLPQSPKNIDRRRLLTTNDANFKISQQKIKQNYLQKNENRIKSHTEHLIMNKNSTVPFRYQRWSKLDAFEQEKIIKEVSIKNSLSDSQSDRDKIKFMSNIDEYVLSLQTIKSYRNKQQQEKNINQIQQMTALNYQIRKKIKQYQTKIEDLQQSAAQHLNNCKKKEKAYKNKINQIMKGLANAVSKIDKQKQQIQTLGLLFKTFGKKVQNQYNFLQDNSSQQLQQQINKSLLKAIRPIRTQSEYKVSKKKQLNATINKHENYQNW